MVLISRVCDVASELTSAVQQHPRGLCGYNICQNTYRHIVALFFRRLSPLSGLRPLQGLETLRYANFGRS
jgi:hypothetical protein